MVKEPTSGRCHSAKILPGVKICSRPVSSHPLSVRGRVALACRARSLFHFASPFEPGKRCKHANRIVLHRVDLSKPQGAKELRMGGGLNLKNIQNCVH
jgi:hypothetical protein